MLPQDYRQTMSQFCTGVVVVTGCLDGEPLGFTAQSFASLSLDPPLVSVSPALSSRSWPRIRDAGHFGINILAEDQQGLCELFARSGEDKFGDLPWATAETGAPILPDVLAWIDCSLEAEHPAGDHTIAVGRVQELRLLRPECTPLLFFRGGYGTFRS